MTAERRSARLVSPFAGADVVFSVTSNEPGDIQVALGESAPTEEELIEILAHPEAELIQLSLILAAIESWEEWNQYAHDVLMRDLNPSMVES